MTDTNETKHHKIKNKFYRNFLDNGIIDEYIKEEHLEKALNNITQKNTLQGRALLICLYYTGARPIEVIDIKAKDITKDGPLVNVKLPGKKRGNPRTVKLRYGLKYVRKLYNYSQMKFDEENLFYAFKGDYKRVIRKNGVIVGERTDHTAKIYYYIKKWFTGVIDGSITPYVLRHNRFSKLSEAGASMEELRFLKGSKTYTSIFPYLHLSGEKSKKLSRIIK